MYYNPFMPSQTPPMPNPQQSVVQVNGENGARAYQIGPNSSAWLLDTNGLQSWLVTTDGAGYKTVSCFDVTPHQPTPAPDISGLEDRIKKLETEMGELINELTGNSGTAKSKQTNKQPVHE